MGFGKCGDGGEGETVQRETGQSARSLSFVALEHLEGTALNEDPLKLERKLGCLKSHQLC